MTTDSTWVTWIPKLALVGFAVLLIGLHFFALTRWRADQSLMADGIKALAEVLTTHERVGIRQQPTTQVRFRFTVSQGPHKGQVIEHEGEVDPATAAHWHPGDWVDIRYRIDAPEAATLVEESGAEFELIGLFFLDLLLLGGLIIAWRKHMQGN